MSNRERMEQKFKGRTWKGEHPCGTGSIEKNTKLTKDFLVDIVEKYDIKTISNAGAGKPDWIRNIKWPHPVEVTHYDIDVKHKDIIKFDITSEVLPKTDLIICRHVLNHLWGWNDLITAAKENFKKSGSTFLLCSYDNRTTGQIKDLGEPLETRKDEPFKAGGTKWFYSLWRLNNG